MNEIGKKDLIVVLDLKPQYSQLIARRLRADRVYCEIVPFSTPAEEIKKLNPKGIIISGGAASVLAEGFPKCDMGIFNFGVPILGIGYGMQLMVYMMGGAVYKAGSEKYSKVNVNCLESPLFRYMEGESVAWMGCTLHVDRAPVGFKVIAHADDCDFAAMEDDVRKFYGVQFHPEITHTQNGNQLLHNFCYNICLCKGDWRMDTYIDNSISAIREQVGDKNVLLGLSGGVDSAVVATLLYKAIGKQLTAVFVDHGLLRLYEKEQVEATFRPILGDKLIVVDAANRFLAKLSGVPDPEQKRKIIGAEFIDVFSETARSIDKLDFLAQGTIYPDVIESGGGMAKTIKSHHNADGLPKELPFCGVVEPLRYLFKDEVRTLGRELGLPDSMVDRQPFPGPGLGIRIIGDITKEKLDILRHADHIFREEIDANCEKETASQYFVILTGLRSIGVKGHERSYDYTLALRCVKSEDFMRASWVRLSHDLLDKISCRITSEVRHVNRIVYDITSKPPATVEWE